jgi:hypothetical protein
MDRCVPMLQNPQKRLCHWRTETRLCKTLTAQDMSSALPHIEGLTRLEKGGLRVTLTNAVIKTTIRARQLMTS